MRRFWSAERGLFVGNLPWEDEEGAARLDDRSLATALLFDQCPGGRARARRVAALASPPDSMGLSYPANSHWRMQALARHGRIDAVLRELRERWAVLPSVVLNNTTPEDWAVRPDSSDQWSHCAVGPLFVLYMEIAGIRPAAPRLREGGDPAPARRPGRPRAHRPHAARARSSSAPSTRRRATGPG